MAEYKIVNTFLNFYQIEIWNYIDKYKSCQYIIDLHIEYNENIPSEKKWIVMSRSDKMKRVLREFYGDDVLFFKNKEEIIEMMKHIVISENNT